MEPVTLVLAAAGTAAAYYFWKKTREDALATSLKKPIDSGSISSEVDISTISSTLTSIAQGDPSFVRKLSEPETALLSITSSAGAPMIYTYQGVPITLTPYALRATANAAKASVQSTSMVAAFNETAACDCFWGVSADKLAGALAGTEDVYQGATLWRIAIPGLREALADAAFPFAAQAYGAIVAYMRRADPQFVILGGNVPGTASAP